MEGEKDYFLSASIKFSKAVVCRDVTSKTVPRKKNVSVKNDECFVRDEINVRPIFIEVKGIDNIYRVVSQNVYKLVYSINVANFLQVCC